MLASSVLSLVAERSKGEAGRVMNVRRSNKTVGRQKARHGGPQAAQQQQRRRAHGRSRRSHPSEQRKGYKSKRGVIRIERIVNVSSKDDEKGWTRRPEWRRASERRRPRVKEVAVDV